MTEPYPYPDRSAGALHPGSKRRQPQAGLDPCCDDRLRRSRRLPRVSYWSSCQISGSDPSRHDRPRGVVRCGPARHAARHPARRAARSRQQPGCGSASSELSYVPHRPPAVRPRSRLARGSIWLSPAPAATSRSGCSPHPATRAGWRSSGDGRAAEARRQRAVRGCPTHCRRSSGRRGGMVRHGVWFWRVRGRRRSRTVRH
jgi:hypothetical protein